MSAATFFCSSLAQPRSSSRSSRFLSCASLSAFVRLPSSSSFFAFISAMLALTASAVSLSVLREARHSESLRSVSDFAASAALSAALRVSPSPESASRSALSCDIADSVARFSALCAPISFLTELRSSFAISSSYLSALIADADFASSSLAASSSRDLCSRSFLSFISSFALDSMPVPFAAEPPVIEPPAFMS